MDRFTRPRPAAIAAALALVVAATTGCGDDDLTGPGAPGTGRIDVWVLDSGSLSAPNDPLLFVTALTLRPDGTGRVHFRDDRVGGVHSVRAEYSLGEPFFSIGLVGLGLGKGDAVFPQLELRIDEISLELTKPDGTVCSFSRRESLPPGIAPAPLPELERFTGLAMPDPRTDLAVDGDALVFNSAAAVETFDFSAGAMGTPLSTALDRYVLSNADLITGGTGFWTVAPSTPQSITLRSIGRGLDLVGATVDVSLLQPTVSSIKAAAFSPSTGDIWIHGPEASAGHRMVVMAPPAGGRAILRLNETFDRPVSAMAFSPMGLWAVVSPAGQALYCVDPATLQVTASFALPTDETVVWYGLAVTDAGVLLLGADLAAGAGVLVVLDHP
ncbi:MAG TPA: hypothetical protein VKU85_05275 [bacterium]|nr:hypothetical protein [bacterium]